jgi:hypothetical protein
MDLRPILCPTMQLLMQLRPIIQVYYGLDENSEKFKELSVQF